MRTRRAGEGGTVATTVPVCSGLRRRARSTRPRRADSHAPSALLLRTPFQEIVHG